MPRGGWTHHGISEAERFWSKVDKSGGPDACWIWTAGLFEKGYGQFTTAPINGKKKSVRAHRYAFELVNGPIPDGLGALHKCDRRACVNPGHIFVGTQQDNMKDADQKGRVFIPWLSDETVAQIRNFLALGAVQAEIAKRLGIHRDTVGLIARGKHHKVPKNKMPLTT